MPDIEDLRRQLKALEEAIAEARARMPAHSAKPAMMAELIDLQDRRDEILEQIEAAEKKAGKDQ